MLTLTQNPNPKTLTITLNPNDARHASLANMYHSWKFYRAVGEKYKHFLARSVDHNELPGGYPCGQPSRLPWGDTLPKNILHSSKIVKNRALYG